MVAADLSIAIVMSVVSLVRTAEESGCDTGCSAVLRAADGSGPSYLLLSNHTPQPIHHALLLPICFMLPYLERGPAVFLFWLHRLKQAHHWHQDSRNSTHLLVQSETHLFILLMAHKKEKLFHCLIVSKCSTLNIFDAVHELLYVHVPVFFINYMLFIIVKDGLGDHFIWRATNMMKSWKTNAYLIMITTLGLQKNACALLWLVSFGLSVYIHTCLWRTCEHHWSLKNHDDRKTSVVALINILFLHYVSHTWDTVNSCTFLIVHEVLHEGIHSFSCTQSFTYHTFNTGYIIFKNVYSTKYCTVQNVPTV